MRRLTPSFFVAIISVLAISGCGQNAVIAPEPFRIDVAAEDLPPPETPVSADVLPLTPGPTPSQQSSQELSLSTDAPARPPANPNLGDTWTRPLDEIVMVYVPAGEFQMGSTDAQVDEALVLCNKLPDICVRESFELEQPSHTVALDGFWIDRTEVTNAQYRRCVDASACEEPEFWIVTYKDAARRDHPMVHVDWYEAESYCEWATARLPTEAEWEYAARGPEGRTFPWGDEFDGARLNYCDANCSQRYADSSVDDRYSETAPVGSYPEGASWCGALDMAGNVGEYVGDWFGEYSSEWQENPSGPAAGLDRMQHGGSWWFQPARIRSAFRIRDRPENTHSFVGFRCAMDGD